MKKTPFERYMLRPAIYQTFSRFMVILTVVMLWHRFWGGGLPLSWGTGVAAAGFAVMAWMAYLRLDGLHVPKFDRKLFGRKKKPDPTFGDLSDHIDEEIISFEELDDDEKDLCLLIANLVCCGLFALLSFIF